LTTKHTPELVKDYHEEAQSRMTPRERLLTTAKECVVKDRATTYDTPERSFNTIAKFWSTFLEKKITETDVASMMALLKIARLQHNPTHWDSWVDLAGYAACGSECSLNNE